VSILEKTVWITLNNHTIKHYEDLKYKIPRRRNNRGKLTVPRGTIIEVKVEDLTPMSAIKVTKICDECGKTIPDKKPYFAILVSRNKGDGRDRCFNCGLIFMGKNRRENVKYENSLEYYAKTNNKTYLIDEFSEKNEKTVKDVSYGTRYEWLWNCPVWGEEHEYTMSMNDRTNAKGNGCPYCAGKRVNRTNCIATTHPHIVKLLLNAENGYLFTASSNRKVDWKCPDCGEIFKNKIINHIVRQGLFCPTCSDGIPITEKFTYNVLKQLNIDFTYQYYPKWAEIKEHENEKLNGRKRYDYYLYKLKAILEINGIQHENGRLGELTAEEQKENDRLKELLSIKNIPNVRYMRVKMYKSTFECLNNNLEKALRQLDINISNVDWIKAWMDSQSSFVKKACDLYNEGLGSPYGISYILGLSKDTIRIYLKRGMEIGWCDYNPKKEKRKGLKNLAPKKKPVVQLSLGGEFISEFESGTEAGRQLNIHQSDISLACRGERNHAGGFLWMYLDDYYNQENDFVIPTNFQLKRSVVQLSLDGDFVNLWETISEAESKLNIRGITAVCKDKLKSCGGFMWIYKKDYEKNINDVKPYMRETNAKPIVQLTTDNELVQFWSGATEAFNKTGINNKYISLCCTGKQKTAGGFKWMFKDDYENT
jgi:hypothetical protein